MNNSLKNVRLEELKPFEKENGKKTGTIWITDSNVNESLNAIEKYKIEHLHLQTSTLDFIKDKRCRNLRGISIQYEVEDITPLYRFSKLTHLGLPEKSKTKIDFASFPQLIFLSGQMPNDYSNFEYLNNLKRTYLFNYRRPDFTEFSQCKQLEKLEICGIGCENLKGLQNLKKLREINLEKCPKLTSLEGLSSQNEKLTKIRLYNCKKLKDAHQLIELPQLEDLFISKVLELESLNFLSKLHNLKALYIHPEATGVKNNAFFPLVKKLQEMGKIEQLKSWKRLELYLTNHTEPTTKGSELRKILENLSIKTWGDKKEYGLEQYSDENIEKAIDIFSELIHGLEENISSSIEEKTELIQNAVIRFNKLNNELGGDFIETGEREELCDIFDNIADSVGINALDYEDGIASEWREW